MSEIFNSYSDISNTALESTDKAVSQSAIDAKALHRLKKVTKLLKKQNKYLWQICKNRAEEEHPIDEKWAVSKEDRSKTTGREEKAFFSKLGDVFLKALPSLLTTVASAIVTAIFGRGFKRARTSKGAIT